MFEAVPGYPDDPILALIGQYKKDPNPHKINLSVGIYQDENGHTPVLRCVKQAEQDLIYTQTSKAYLGVAGDEYFAHQVEELLLGKEHPLIEQKRIATSQTVGGTSALRLAGELVQHINPAANIWLSDPTWLIHTNLYKHMGFNLQTYPYYCSKRHSLRFDEMLTTLESAAAGDVVLLQTNCHNPTGVDLTASQWQKIAQLAQKRGFLPLLDSAYQGFSDELEHDTTAVRAFAATDLEFLITHSFSKNLGLYNERVGTLSVITKTRNSASNTFSLLKTHIRSLYSNPPTHGAAVARTIIANPTYYSQWQQELGDMRRRITHMRSLLVEHLAAHQLDKVCGHIKEQQGLFSLLPLTPTQVTQLRENYSIYLLDSGRINLAGITPNNVERFCSALNTVLSSKA